MKLSAEGSEFYFYYSLLGNDITSEPFHNLLSPDFEPERASVRIRSSKRVLHTFLSQQPSLQVRDKCLISSLLVPVTTRACITCFCLSSSDPPVLWESFFGQHRCFSLSSVCCARGSGEEGGNSGGSICTAAS